MHGPQIQAAANVSGCTVLGRGVSPGMKWGRPAGGGVTGRHEAELGRHLALALAEVRQDAVLADRLRQRPPEQWTAP